MKKVILVGIMFMLFMGVVSASSFNGDYKGNPIVKIYSSGNEIKPEDVPALIYNGRTVVPISLLKKLGVGVEWNQSDYSVSIELPKADYSKVYSVVAYADLLDYYNAVMRLGDRINLMRANLIIDIDNVGRDYNINESLNFADNSVKDSIDELARLKGNYETIITSARNFNIVDTDLGTILQTYSKSIDTFKLSLEKIHSYNTNINYVTEFNNLINTGTDYSIDAGTIAYNGYTNYFKLMHSLEFDSAPEPIPDAPKKTPAPTPDVIYVPVDSTPSTIETKMDGTFEGWDGDTIFKLANGQIWQQVSYAYTYHYAYRPDVLIYKDGAVYKMKVDGVEDTITVKRLK